MDPMGNDIVLECIGSQEDVLEIRDAVPDDTISDMGLQYYVWPFFDAGS